MYPGEFRQGEIGWRLFWVLWNRIGKALALKRVNETQATLYGTAIFGNDAAQRERERDIQAASVF